MIWISSNQSAKNAGLSQVSAFVQTVVIHGVNSAGSLKSMDQIQLYIFP